MELSSGELISYLKIHFKIYKNIDLANLAKDLDITVNDYKLCNLGYIISINLTENNGGAIIKW